MRTKSMLATLLGAALAAAGASPLAAKPVQRAVSAEADARVEIELFTGSVTVVGWDRESVEVAGDIETRNAELLLESTGRRVEVGIEWNREKPHPGKAVLTVRVPEGADVVVEGVNLTAEVRDVKGDVSVETVNGGATVGGAPASVDVEIVNGTVVVDAATADVSVESVSGRIDIRGAHGVVGAQTVSGDIALAVSGLTEGDFSSVSGTIRFTGDLAETGVLDAESHSGAVVLAFPASISARFALETFTGGIESDFPGGTLVEEDFGLGKEMSLRTGDGDAEVTVTTFSGNIAIRRN